MASGATFHPAYTRRRPFDRSDIPRFPRSQNLQEEKAEEEEDEDEEEVPTGPPDENEQLNTYLRDTLNLLFGVFGINELDFNVASTTLLTAIENIKKSELLNVGENKILKLCYHAELYPDPSLSDDIYYANLQKWIDDQITYRSRAKVIEVERKYYEAQNIELQKRVQELEKQLDKRNDVEATRVENAYAKHDRDVEKLQKDMNHSLTGYVADTGSELKRRILKYDADIKKIDATIKGTIGQDEAMLELFVNVISRYQEVNKKVFEDFFSGDGSKWTDVVVRTTGTEPNCTNRLTDELGNMRQFMAIQAFGGGVAINCCVECQSGRQAQAYTAYVEKSFMTDDPSKPPLDFVVWFLCAYHERLFPYRGRRYVLTDYKSEYSLVGYVRSEFTGGAA